ncbi:PHP-associated domain-containing protein, partial [Escherichia coli]
MDLAQRRGLRMVATSDAHTTDMVGLYALRLEAPASSEEELADMIRAGAYSMEADPSRLEALNRERQSLWHEAAA